MEVMPKANLARVAADFSVVAWASSFLIGTSSWRRHKIAGKDGSDHQTHPGRCRESNTHSSGTCVAGCLRGWFFRS